MRARNRPDVRSFLLTAFLLILCVLPAGADWQTGVHAFQAEDWDAARAQFQAVTDAQPAWYGGHLMLGRTYLELDRHEEALASLEKAWTLDARPEIALLLAQTALKQHETELAARALEADPPAAMDATHRARWHALRARTTGDAASRIADLEHAVELDPADRDLRLALGDAALQAGRPALAAEHLEAARDARSDGHGGGDLKVLTRLVRAHLALADEAQGDARRGHCADAAGPAVEIARLEPEKAPYRLAAGRALLCSGDAAAAEPHLVAAAEASDDWLPAYDLARARLALQRWQEAEAALRPWTGRTTAGDVGSRKAQVKIHRAMGRALEGQQRFLDAIEHYEIAGDEDGIAHARAGQEALDHNEKVAQWEELQGDIEDLEDQLEATSDEEGRLR